MRVRKFALLPELIGHFTMGFALGLSFALLLTLIDAFGVRNLVADSGAPLSTIWMLVGTFALMFGIGATLTGLVFTMAEGQLSFARITARHRYSINFIRTTWRRSESAAGSRERLRTRHTWEPAGPSAGGGPSDRFPRLTSDRPQPRHR